MRSKFTLSFKTILIAVCLIRLALIFLPSFEVDESGWRFWAVRMTQTGPSNFYSTQVFTDNPPGFLYIFWTAGEIKNAFPQFFNKNKTFDFLLKLPTNVADILTGYLIYLILKKKSSEKLANLGFLLYTLNPAIFFNSSIWGQFDGGATLFLVLSSYLLLVKKIPEAAAASFAIAWAIKPQVIAFAPILGLTFLFTLPFKKWITSLISFVIMTLIIYLPFFPTDPIYGITYVNARMTGIFNCTSCFAFNFWGMFGNWQSDQTIFHGLSLIDWSFILLTLSFIPIFFLKPIKKHFREPFFYLFSALSIFSFFIFTTRMHERYLFPFFAFFLIASLSLKSRVLIISYVVISALSIINLYLPYTYYSPQLHLTPQITAFLESNFTNLSALSFASFLFLLIYSIRMYYQSKLK